MADAGADATLRRDAFQVLLVVSGSARMTPVALEGLASTEPAIRQLSAAALARGLDDYTWRQVGKLHMTADAQDYRGNARHDGGMLIVPEAPKGLKAEAIR